MEPDVVPLHPSSPPPLDDGDGEAGSEEDEFGDFGGFSVAVSSTSLRYPSTAMKPATNQPNCSLHHPVEQFQPTVTVNSCSSMGQIHLEGQEYNPESRVHLTNGHPERGHNSGPHIVASAVGACSPREETGFADFTVFAEQAAHPWCCGFTPLASAEQWDRRVEVKQSSKSLGEQIWDPGQEVDIMDSEPRSQCAYTVKQVCTIEHCEKIRDAALVQPCQDHCQPQEAQAVLNFPFGEPGRRERRHSFSYLQTEVQDDRESEEDQEKSTSIVPHTFSVYESVSEDLASFCDDLSLDCPSADLEPNVSSLTSHSQGDPIEWDPTDDEEEDDELGNCGHSDSHVIDHSLASLRGSTAEKVFHYCKHSATQETVDPTSDQSQAGTHAEEDKFSEFKEYNLDQGFVQTADAEVQILGKLPPSDSFADFCSAPTQEEGEESWAQFKEQGTEEEGNTWPQFREQVSSLRTDGSTEEEKDRPEQCGLSQKNSCQATLTCCVQQLVLDSFPAVEVPDVEGEEEVLGLGAVFESEVVEEEMPELSSRSQWIQQGMWWPHQDIHSALGLRFQWGGSHANRTLLRCLGVDTRNIVFLGMKKQPMAVPAFASSLGMLEPTKDSVPAVCSPGLTARAPPRDPPKDPMQEALPSSKLGWSSRGLSSSQDGTSPRRAPHFWGWK